jgi:hypothetical protein
MPQISFVATKSVRKIVSNLVSPDDFFSFSSLLCSRLIFSHLNVHPSGNESRRLDDVSSEASSLAWHVATHRLDGELQVSCRCASGFSASSRVPPGRRSLACAASMCACGSPAALQRILAWLLHVLPTSLLTF